jgi:hypothetical protein
MAFDADLEYGGGAMADICCFPKGDLFRQNVNGRAKTGEITVSVRSATNWIRGTEFITGRLRSWSASACRVM